MAGIFGSYGVGVGFCGSGSAFRFPAALMRSFSACFRAFICLPRRRQIDHMTVTAINRGNGGDGCPGGEEACIHAEGPLAGVG